MLHFQPLPLTLLDFTSSSKVTLLSRKELEAKLIAKAFENTVFKDKLLTNPRLTIEAEFSKSLPDNLNVNVLEETDSISYFVLPHNPYQNVKEAELLHTIGMTLEDIATWVLSQHRGISTQEKRLYTKLVTNAWRDPAFKKLLLEDPQVVFQHELGKRFPDYIDLRVVEETDQKVFIVIPYLMDTFSSRDEIDHSLINMPVVIGSHADSSNPIIGCDKEKTTHTNTLICLDTRAPIDECRETLSTKGFNGC